MVNPWSLIGSLSNHDDDGNKNSTNLLIWQWKTVFLHALHVHLSCFDIWHFEDVLVLSTTWNDLFCNCVGDVGIWWQIFNFVFLFPKRWFQFNSRIVNLRAHFSSIMSLNNWKMIAETRSYIFRCRSRLRRRRVCFKLPNNSLRRRATGGDSTIMKSFVTKLSCSLVPRHSILT